MDRTETAAGTLPVGVRDAAALPSCAMAAGTAAGNYLMQYLLQRFAPTTGETD